MLELQPGPHALLHLDLDHFKIINDHCGHNAGDEFLVIFENTEREDPELIPYLHELGIQYGQGYGIHRPAPL